MYTLKRYRAMGLLVLIAVAIIFGFHPLMSYESLGSERAILTKGHLDVRTLDFSKGICHINGEVRVYENQLINPAQRLPLTGVTTEQPMFKEMPYAWPASSGVTHASYQFELEGLEPGKAYGFYVMDGLTALAVYVDGQAVVKMGEPSDDPGQTVGSSRVQAAFFVADSDKANVVIHVSSASSHPMGIWQKTLFGPQDLVHGYAVKARQSDSIMIGAIMFMTVYMWIAFLVMKRDRAILYFSMLCTAVSVKALYSGQQLGYEGFPLILNYEIGLRVAYIMVPVIVIFVTGFVSEVFKGHDWSRGRFGRGIQMGIHGLSVTEILLIALSSQRFYQETFVFYQGVAMASALVVLWWTVSAFRKGVEGAGIYGVAFIVFIGVGVNDILYSNLLIDTGYYLSFGLFILILAQAAILAMRMQRAMNTEAYLKLNLENLVDERTEELEREKNRFEALSKVDSLTHLFNKGYMSEVLHFEMEGYKRYHGALSIMMIDLDRFKRVNDTFGHLAGDDVLKRVAQVLSDHSRRTDIVGRFGGEEFLVVLRFTDRDQARAHAEQLRLAIEDLRFEWEGKDFRVTASFGLATAHEELANEKQLLAEADRALYKAKNAGRNCVVG